MIFPSSFYSKKQIMEAEPIKRRLRSNKRKNVFNKKEKIKDKKKVCNNCFILTIEVHIKII